MSNPTPPTILRNLYAKLETMEKELNENPSSSPIIINHRHDEENPKQAVTPMSPLSLPSNSTEIKRGFNNIIDQLSRLSTNDNSNYSSASSPQTLYQDSDYAKHASVRSDSTANNNKGRVSYASNSSMSNFDRDNDYNSPKINYVRAAPTPPAINTYYQGGRYSNPRGIPNEEDPLESPYETDIPRYYGNSLPQSFPNQYDRSVMSSPGIASSYGAPFSPESNTYYNDVGLPVDDYDYKHQSDYSGKEIFIPPRHNNGQRHPSEYSSINYNKSLNGSFDLNADLEAHAMKGYNGDSINDSISESKSITIATTEIDMNFDASILSDKKKKRYMFELVNSNNFHKGGVLSVGTGFLAMKQKTLFYALTTHRLYAFEEDKSDAECLANYTIDRNTKIQKANVYAGVKNFELETFKNGSKTREVFEFECASRDDREEWIACIKKVIQLHKYHGKTLPPAPPAVSSNVPYTVSLKTPNMKPQNYPTPSISPEISPANYSMNSSYVSNNSYMQKGQSPSNQYNNASFLKHSTSVSSQGSGNGQSYQKVSPMYAGQNNARRASPQPMLAQSPPNNTRNMNVSLISKQMGQMGRVPSPNINAAQINPQSPQGFAYKSSKNFSINQFVNNSPPSRAQQSPRPNIYQRSPMQRPQGN